MKPVHVPEAAWQMLCELTQTLGTDINSTAAWAIGFAFRFDMDFKHWIKQQEAGTIS